MLFRNLQRLLKIMHATGEDGLSDLFLAFDLRFHLDSARSPGTFQLVIQMTGRALAGKSNVLTQQVIGVRRRFRNQLHAVANVTKHIARHKLNVINQIIQQRGIRFAVTDHALLVVVRLGPEIATCIPRRQLHHKLFVGFIHHRGLIRGRQIGLDIKITQELLLGVVASKHIHRWSVCDRRGAPLLFCKEGVSKR